MVRDISLDVLRGITVLEMENAETCDHPFFDHAAFEEKKFNYADSIFPCFSFLSGMGLGRTSPAKRDIQLIGLGLCFNAIPSLCYGTKLRIPGVLQRHGLASLILKTIPNTNSYYTPAILTSVWLAISILFAKNKADPFDRPENTAQHFFDKPVFADRIYRETFDPEGLLGALCTAVTIWSGIWFNSQNFSLKTSVIIGCSLMVLGKSLSLLFPKYLPISKPLWTPTFVMASSGWSILKYTLVKLSLPYIPSIIIQSLNNVGQKSLEVYFAGEFFYVLLTMGENKSLWFKAKNTLTSLFKNENISRAILTTIFDVSLVGLAAFFTKYDVKFRFF